MPSAQRQQRRLTIVACRQVYSGRNQLGHQYTIFEVEAKKEDGTLVNEKLRSFEPLPIGQPVDVMIEPFVSERHGRSFTLHLTAGTDDAEGIKQLESVQKRVGELEQRVEALEAKPPSAPGGEKQW